MYDMYGLYGLYGLYNGNMPVICQEQKTLLRVIWPGPYVHFYLNSSKGKPRDTLVLQF